MEFNHKNGELIDDGFSLELRCFAGKCGVRHMTGCIIPQLELVVNELDDFSMSFRVGSTRSSPLKALL